MRTEFTKEPTITTGICLKLIPENNAEKVLINDFFGNVNKMGDVEFVTIDKNEIEEVILYKIKK